MSESFEICGFEKASRDSFEQRFWSKMVQQPSGCWEWTAYRMPLGYGWFAVARNEMRLAHRVAWELERGPIPEGMYVLHKCDNPPCICPDHLVLGTAKDNTHDMLDKGRHAHGERHPKTTLTEDKVIALRRMRVETDLSYRKIGVVFGIGAGSVCKIVNRLRWTHI